MPLIDLSLPIVEEMAHHPLHPRSLVVLDGTLDHRTTRRWMGEHPKHGRVSFKNEQLVLSGHAGTHVDAPLHADPEGGDVVSIDLSACIGPASVLDLRSAAGPHVSITVDVVAAAAHGRELASVVLLLTGWADVLALDPVTYYTSCPGLDDEAACWLREQGARCVGIDAPSIDTPRAVGAPAHMRFLRERPAIVVIENLCRLEQLPLEVPNFVAAPLPLGGSTGSPVRAFASWPDGPVSR